MPGKGAVEIVAEALAQARRNAEQRDAHCLDPGAHPGPYQVNDGHETVCRFKCLECGEDHRVYPDPVEGCFTFGCACEKDQDRG